MTIEAATQTAIPAAIVMSENGASSSESLKVASLFGAFMESHRAKAAELVADGAAPEDVADAMLQAFQAFCSK